MFILLVELLKSTIFLFKIKLQGLITIGTLHK